MFNDFLYLMRHRGITVSMSEWIVLMEALTKGLSHQSCTSFYFLCRALTVKSEILFDLYDQVFSEYFEGVSFPEKIHAEIEDWLKNPVTPRMFSQEELAKMKNLNLDELRKEFAQRLAEQKERHDGGNHWVGTGGTSPFGHSGFHPGGLRLGGPGQNRSAAQIAEKRHFKNLRSDAILDTRQIGIALKKLRKWQQFGSSDQLDIEATIHRTCRNGGDIDFVFTPKKKSAIKILLMMDVGGSMTPYSAMCEKLFSAAYQAKHFKNLELLYFHNSPYEYFFTNAERRETIATDQVFRFYDSSWYLLMIGDAAMHPWELTVVGGSIDYFHHNETPGIEWIKRIRTQYPQSVWLNPKPKEQWEIASNRLVRSVFPSMFPLSLLGLEQAMHSLMKGKPR